MTSKTPPINLAIDPQLAEDIEISRRELAEGKGIPHAQVMHEMDDLISTVEKLDEHKDLCAKSPHRLPNAETIAALEEGGRIANDPARRPAR